MNKRFQGIVIGVLICALFTSGNVFAKNARQMIEAAYANIKIVIDGEQIEPKDAAGNTVEPFIYNGTTYLPVRAVGAALGKEVSWDGVNKVVYLGAKPGETENWLNVCGPYQYGGNSKEYRLEDNKHFSMSGKKYTNGFTLGHYNDGEAMFNLDSKYNSVSFTVGHVDGTYNGNATLNIYIDGIIAYTKELNYDDVAQKVTVPLNGALQMKIVCDGGSGLEDCKWGFSEGKFE